MSKLIIHIGMPKTGSSSIQETLFAKGGHGDFYYTDFGVANQGGKLRSYFSDDSHEWPGHQASCRSPDQVKAFNEAVGVEIEKVKAQGGCQIISGEDIFHMDEAALSRMRDSFCESFDQIKIIGYVRSPASFMASAFVQFIKNHNQTTLNVKQLWPQYRAKLEKFDRVFGRENVVLRSFDNGKLIDGDVVQDFCHFVGAPIDTAEVCRVNESLSLEATAALFVYRREGPCYQPYPDKPVDNNRLVNLLAGFGERKLRFADSLIRPVIEREAADLEWIESRLGESFRVASSIDDDAISCEQDLLNVAESSREALSAFVSQQARGIKPTSQQIANWIEKLRVTITGRASNGVTPVPSAKSVFFTDEQRARLTEDKMGPAAALRELALAFEHHGHLVEARNCIRAALELRPDAKDLHKLEDRLNK